MDNRPIGVFDSGVGGLTAVRAMLRDYPNESIVYFGDTARVPYGNREKDDITNLSLQDVRFLRSKIDDRFQLEVIETVRGVGYVIR